MYLLELAGDDDALAAHEARAAARDVDRLGPGLALAGDLDRARVRGLAFTHRASELVGRTSASIPAARELLETAPLERTGTVAVRARSVRNTAPVSTSEAEAVLGQVLVDRGLAVDLEEPEHTLRVLFASDEAAGVSVGAVGWEVAASVRNFGERVPGERPFVQPGSMGPLLARAIANMAGARPGRTVLDPMCGTGGVVLEAGLLGATVIASDVRPRMVRGTRTNLADALDRNGSGPTGAPPGGWSVLCADAARLPLLDGAADGIVLDVPYGRQSPIASGSRAELLADGLAECRRLAPRTVLVADRPVERVARAAGWSVTAQFERPVHRSLTRHVLVLD